MFRRLYTVVVLDSIVAMERCMEAPTAGGRSPLFKAMTALGATSILLTLLNFVVLSGQLQADLADRAWEFANGLSDGALKDALLAASPLYRHAAWTLGCVTCYFLVPAFIVVAVFREPLSAYGLNGRGFVRHLPIYLLLLAPVLVAVVIVSGDEAFQGTYPFYRNPKGWIDMLGWELLYATQFFALEFFFRGFLLHATKQRLGVLAVPAMVIPYVMIHFTKPMPEAFGAVVAGTVLGVLALRTGTIWGGVFVHAAVAISMDVASLLQRGGLPGAR
jgi:membrane protease YdiL (CAAX protease family)